MRERLALTPLLAGVSRPVLDRLAASAGELEAPAGRTLIERGQPGSGLFLLEHGTAVVELPDGERELVAGDVFGELALLGDGRRTARVRARTDVRCIALPRAAVERLLAEEPAVEERLRRLAADRLGAGI